jgi:hypothetical protein
MTTNGFFFLAVGGSVLVWPSWYQTEDVAAAATAEALELFNSVTVCPGPGPTVSFDALAGASPHVSYEDALEKYTKQAPPE